MVSTGWRGCLSDDKIALLGSVPQIQFTQHTKEGAMKNLDFRSDTVTKPTPAMRKAMAEAEVGDDVYGEDPTIKRLEALAASMLGTEASIFASSGTQGNLLALLSHCERGDEYIVGQQAHTYRYEGGGGAVFGSIQPQPIEAEPDGSLDLQKVKHVIKPYDFHFARTRLLCLENTHNGKVLPVAYHKQAMEFAREHSLSLHLDGARIFNAAVKLGIDVREISQYADTISVCLSKGLGAPVGSALCGPRELITKARRWRKLLGGGMRQAGILAAAGIIALTEHVDRLAEDHANAEFLMQELLSIDKIAVHPSSGQTNMVFIRLSSHSHQEFAEYLKSRNILVSPRDSIRLVTHLDIATEDIHTFIVAVKDFLVRT
jgi:threonine aldolase